MPRLDSGAVEGLPLKLIIIAVILAMTLPTAWYLFRSYDSAQTEAGVRGEIERLAVSAKEVYAGASGKYLGGKWVPGSALKITLNFRGGYFANIEYVKIGGPLGAVDFSWTQVHYKLGTGPDQTYVVENPNVPLTCKSVSGFASLVLAKGSYTLLLENKYDDSLKMSYVEAGVAK